MVGVSAGVKRTEPLVASWGVKSPPSQRVIMPVQLACNLLARDLKSDMKIKNWLALVSPLAVAFLVSAALSTAVRASNADWINLNGLPAFEAEVHAVVKDDAGNLYVGGDFFTRAVMLSTTLLNGTAVAGQLWGRG